MLAAALWREELRARQTLALRIAQENERLYGYMDNRTLDAYQRSDLLSAVARVEGA